jgi:hypothetical protein
LSDDGDDLYPDTLEERDRIDAKLAELHSQFNFAVGLLGQFQQKLAKRHPIDRDDVARLRNFGTQLPEIRRIARESKIEDDRLAYALISAGLPAVVAGFMRLYGVDPSAALLEERDPVAAAAAWNHLDGAVVAGTVNATAPVMPEDGPAGLDGFRFNGKVLRPLTPKPFLLLRHLWTSKDHTATFEELAGPVFDDHAIIPDKSNVGTHRSALNAFFKRHKVPFQVVISGRMVSLRRLPSA